jgi:hypothetical protein
MNSTLKDISKIVAQANDLLYARHTSISTIMGIMDETLRKRGIKADAVTVDCHAVDKKIVFLMHDEKQGMVDIAIGNKQGTIHSSSVYELSKLSVSMIVDILEENFIV